MFEWLGPFIFRHRWATLWISGLFLVAAVAVLLRGGHLTTGRMQNVEAELAQRRVERVLGHSTDSSFVVIFQDKEWDPEGDEFTQAMNAALAPLKQDAHVASVVTPEDAPGQLQSSLVDGKGHAAAALVTLQGTQEQMLRAYPAVRKQLRSDRLTITCAGLIPFNNDLDETLEHDLLHAELISLPLAVLVLLLVFRTVVAAVLPVGVGALSVLGGIAGVVLLSNHMDMAEFAINVCSLVGLGVAIDYSLFTVSRYREELAAGATLEAALYKAVSTAGRMVAFSGMAVATGMSGLLFFHGCFLEALGIGGAVVVALAVVFALTFLPALLAVLGERIHAGRLPFLPENRSTGGWHRLAQWVMKRPVQVLVPTLALLVLMGAPFLRLQLALADVRVLNAAVEARHGDNLLREHFASLAENRLILSIEFPSAPALNAERIGALYDLSRRLAKLPHVVSVQSLVDAPGEQPSRASYQQMLLNPPPLYAAQIEEGKKLLVKDNVVLLYVLTDGNPEDETSRDVVREVRRDPKVADGSYAVGGLTALDLDVSTFILARAPYAVAWVVGAMLIVLLLLLGSVVLPFKAVAMNFVSIAGSFGALVWVFQDGHLFVHEPRPIETSLPILLFCVLFGLSMDYEVLMLSRMKEAFDRTGDNTLAVAEGLEKTAGLITSAAAIMVAVFGAFALAHVIIVQAVGFGMAIAVTIDATLVRVLLVPATMRLFGNLNWWSPAWVRWLRHKLHLDRIHH